MKFFQNYFLLVGLFFNLNLISEIFANDERINVLVGKNLSSIIISGYDLKREVVNSSNILQHDGQKSIKFNCDGKKGKISAGILARVSSPTGILSWNGERYRGEINIIDAPESGSCHLINRLPLEEYLSSLLAKEMNAKWPIEALKAQAVAARTYALFNIRKRLFKIKEGKDVHYDLESSEKDQVSGSLWDETSQTAKAVKLTKGEILVGERGEIGPIFYHAKCGGKTLTPDQVWDNHVPNYQSVDCPFCKKRGIGDWKYHIPKEQISKIFSRVLRSPDKKSQPLAAKVMRFVPDQFINYQLRFYQDNDLYLVKKPLLRRIFGRGKIPSNYFRVEDSQDGLIIYGQGNGHGVGMCQIGAYTMSDQGQSYQKILSHYFPKFKLSSM